jgi:hypothetical protein
MGHEQRRDSGGYLCDCPGERPDGVHAKCGAVYINPARIPALRQRALLFAGDVPHRRDDGRSSTDGNPSPSALAVDFTPPFGDWP